MLGKVHSSPMNGYPQVFILGIPEKFRGNGLMEFFYRMDIDCRMIAGIDATSLSTADLNAMANQRAAKAALGRVISPGEICCSDVHARAYSEFINTDSEWALILEDDAWPLMFNKSTLSEFPVIAHPTIIKLGKPTKNDEYVNIERLSVSAEVMNGKFKKLIFPTAMAHAYLINRAAAKIALESISNFKIHYTADWPYLWDGKVNFWQAENEMFFQKGDSLIDSSNKRIDILSSEMRIRSRRIKLKENILDFLFISSLKLFLKGGDGFSYFHSRPLRKLALWKHRFIYLLQRDRTPGSGNQI
jgi:hypothetical protein